MRNTVKDARLIRPDLLKKTAKALNRWLKKAQQPPAIRVTLREPGFRTITRKIRNPSAVPIVTVGDLIDQLQLLDKERGPLMKVVVNGKSANVTTEIPQGAIIDVARIKEGM